MPRLPRVQFQGAFYHVISRGTAKQPIFLCDPDRLSFLETLAEVVNRYSWICHAYCLMDNHYHLLIETEQPNLSDGMHALNSNYCHGFNRKYDRVGHLMQGRYQSPLVVSESYLLELARYVCLLYTSDAADDLLCVDLGGRRIIKKKKKKKYLL